MDTKELPPKTKQLIKYYQSLPQTGIRVPYHINNSIIPLKAAVYVGKGSPEEIDSKLVSIAKARKLNPQNVNEWITLAKQEKIGIDCSGFITQILQCYITEVPQLKDKELIDLIDTKTTIIKKIALILSPYKNLNAQLLTNDRNTIKINSVKDIRIADLIRFSGGHHVGLISQIAYDNGKVIEIQFVHSTKGAGVSEDKIIINDENQDLSVQQWIKNPESLNQPEYLYKRRINNNGIRRLKFLT